VAEVLRGNLFARSFGIAFVVAMLCGNGAGVHAQTSRAGEPADGPIILAMGPGAPASEPREAPTLPRYFTINEVLAKLDSQKVNTATNRPSTQIARLEHSAAIPDPVPQPNPTATESAEPFGLTTFRAPEGQLWEKWRKLTADLRAEAKVLDRCRTNPAQCASPAALKFLRLLDETRNLSSRTKIDHINRAINAAVRYTTDLAQYGVPDLWSAPLATLSTGQGDCEDYAIAKYVALRDAGFSSDDLRLLLVHDRMAHQDHAVVGVRQNGRWLMLDNRHEVLLEQKDAWHFTPLFALDQEGVKLFAAPYGAPATSPALVATGPANTIKPATELDAPSAEELGLRTDTFDPPKLRGGL